MPEATQCGAWSIAGHPMHHCCHATEPIHRDPVLDSIKCEYVDVLDPSEIAQWLLDPNLWLAGHARVALLGVDPGAVIGAARADRVIATG